jgi:hypothetical protein
LFNISLTNFEALVKGVDFYLTESNTRIPHQALKGATPKEAITGRWDHQKINEMKNKIIDAKTKRIEANRSTRCLPCLA